MRDTLLQYVFKLSVETPAASPDTSYIRNILAVVKPLSARSLRPKRIILLSRNSPLCPLILYSGKSMAGLRRKLQYAQISGKCLRLTVLFLI